MKRLLYKSLSIVVLVLIVAGIILVLENNDGVTGQVVRKAGDLGSSAVGKLGDAVKNTLRGSAGDLIEKVTELRVSAGDTLKTAALVTEIQAKVEEFDKPDLSAAWDSIVTCAYDVCDGDKYITFADAAIEEGKKGSSRVIKSVINSYKNWNIGDTLTFSNSVIETNALIEDLKDEDIKAKWMSVVECNGVCSRFSDKVLSLIEAINE